jgi:hypothetical protein
MGCKIILIFTSIGVFRLIIFSPINTHMHHLLLGRGGIFFASVLLGSVAVDGSNNEIVRSFLVSVARQRSVGSNREVLSLGSVLRTRCCGNNVLLIQPELQKG